MARRDARDPSAAPPNRPVLTDKTNSATETDMSPNNESA